VALALAAGLVELPAHPGEEYDCQQDDGEAEGCPGSEGQLQCRGSRSFGSCTFHWVNNTTGFAVRPRFRHPGGVYLPTLQSGAALGSDLGFRGIRNTTGCTFWRIPAQVLEIPQNLPFYGKRGAIFRGKCTLMDAFGRRKRGCHGV
jgi:hypothetical protein